MKKKNQNKQARKNASNKDLYVGVWWLKPEVHSWKARAMNDVRRGLPVYKVNISPSKHSKQD